MMWWFPLTSLRRGNRRADSQKGGGGPPHSPRPPRAHSLRKPAAPAAPAAALRAPPPAAASRNGGGAPRVSPPAAPLPGLRSSASTGVLVGPPGGGELRASPAASQAAAEIYAFLSSLPLEMSSSTLGPGLVYTKTRGRMFLGTLAHALNEKLLLSLGVEVVVTTAWPYGAWPLRQRQLYEKLGIRHFLHPLLDESSQMIRFEQLPLAAMREALMRGRNVFVHCEKGISRSVSVCMAYLILYEGHTFRSSYYTLRRTRPIARPNLGFIQQLLDFEARVRGAAPEGPPGGPPGWAPVGVPAKLSGQAAEARLKPSASPSPLTRGERGEAGAASVGGPHGPHAASGEIRRELVIGERAVSVASPHRESNSFPGAGGRGRAAQQGAYRDLGAPPKQQVVASSLTSLQGSSSSNSSSSNSSSSNTDATRIASVPSRSSSTTDRNSSSSVNGTGGSVKSSSSNSSSSSSSSSRGTAVLSAAAAAPAISQEKRLCGVSATEDPLPVSAALALTATPTRQAAAPSKPLESPVRYAPAVLWGPQGALQNGGTVTLGGPPPIPLPNVASVPYSWGGPHLTQGRAL